MLDEIVFYEVPLGKLRKNRVQKNVTLTSDQENFIKENYGKMTVGKIAVLLGLTYGRTHKNMRVMGLVRRQKAPVIKMSEYFDIDAFGKYYIY